MIEGDLFISRSEGCLAEAGDQEMEEPEIFSRPGQPQNSPTDTFFLWMGLRPTINPTTQIIYA